jgi:hypothetical protein
MQRFVDSTERLRAAAAYLERFTMSDIQQVGQAKKEGA